MWASFYRNRSTALESLRHFHQLKFLQGHIESIARSRWSRWNFSMSLCKKLDGMQSRMFSLINGSKPRSDESEQQFFARRSRQVGKAKDSFGRFSVHWAHDIVKWRGHVVRNTENKLWAADLLTHRGGSWISNRRLSFFSVNTSRTNTWGRIGGVAIRWVIGYLLAKDIADLNKLKENSHCRRL